MIASDAHVVAVLASLRDAGLAADRDALNIAWSELTGRTAPAAPSGLCDHMACAAPGIPFLEPRGVWCSVHRPQLWRDPGEQSPRWACPRCARCGAPARYPHPRYGTDAVCRAHAPARLSRYLIGDAA